jgi:predicted Zn-dependent peptidase
MYELSSLGNGLRILTVSIPHLQSVSLGFFVGVGSRYESDALAGASHFVEHMLFKGTARRPTAQEIVEAIEGKGGLFNASTGLETTLFWAKVAAPHLPEALDVLSDMLLNATFDPAELEKERAIISEEISYSLDAPDSLAQILVNQLQWPDHPLGRDVIGTHQSVAQLGREALRTYRAEHYHPGDTILGLAGQVTHQQAIALAQTHLADWDPAPRATFLPAPPNRAAHKLHIASKDTEQAHISLSFAGRSRNDPDRHVLRLLNVILGVGMRSRLFQEVRERLGLAYTVDSFVSAMEDTGAVGVYAGVAASQTDKALAAILGQLDRLRQEPIPPEELDRALEFVRGRLALSLEDPFTIASWFARQHLFGFEVLDPEQTLDRLEAVQAADIQRVAQEVFQADQLNLVIVGPFSENGDRFRDAIVF